MRHVLTIAPGARCTDAAALRPRGVAPHVAGCGAPHLGRSRHRARRPGPHARQNRARWGRGRDTGAMAVLPETRQRLAHQGLVRPRRGRIIAGVCAGLGRRLGVSPWLVRLAFVASIVLPGPQFAVYLALWILMPKESRGTW